MGVLWLAKKYGCSAVDQTCAAALELGVSENRFMRRYLERSPQAPLTLRQVDPLIRELIQYRDWFNNVSTSRNPIMNLIELDRGPAAAAHERHGYCPENTSPSGTDRCHGTHRSCLHARPD
jgi:hypothetical protein